MREHHTDTKVSFVVKLTGSSDDAEKKGLHKTLKLTSNLSTSNMTLFDEQVVGRPVRASFPHHAK